MAGVNKVGVRMQVMAAVAAIVLMMMAVAVVARPAKPKDVSCNTTGTYVYPYGSYCSYPAELSTGYTYITIGGWGALAPEYDEANDTYYVRLSETGATYVAVAKSTESGTLLVNTTIHIYNGASQRVLTWRDEGNNDYFLTEQDVLNSTTPFDPFNLLTAGAVILPTCQSTDPSVQCQTYYLESNLGAKSAFGTSTAFGLQAYREGSVTYIKAAPPGSTGDLPIILRGSCSSTTHTSAMPFPTIRSVTA